MQDIYILGSGAMGYLWASYFNHNAKLHFITRNQSAESFEFEKRPGLQTISATKTQPAQLSQNHSKIRFLIVCTKAFDAEKAVISIENNLANDCQILLIQNGMGSQQAIAQRYPSLSIYACSSTEGVFKESDNILVHAGQGENHIGPLTPAAKQNTLTAWLPPSIYTWHENISPILWRKLVINSAINPLTVIYQCQNGALLSNQTAHAHMKYLCLELDALCEQLNLNLTPTIHLAESICQSTANNYSSMYQDHRHQRPTEIHYITGYVIEECKKRGIECPIHEQVAEQIVN